MSPLPSMPLWYKRESSLLPPNTANESDVIVVGGKLILVVFNRPPLAQAVVFYDISDQSSPVHLATQPWAGAMGAMLVDVGGDLHIYGSSPPATLDNALIHSTVDPSSGWALSAPSTIYQLPPSSGMSFNNVGVGTLPDGSYLLSVEQAFSGTKAETYYRSASDPSFATFTNKGAVYLSSQDFCGRTCIRNGGDGWTYLTSDTSSGYCRIARTTDGVPANFKYATNTAYGFLGPGPQDAYPGHVGGNPFYDGNVSYREWSYLGVPIVVSVYFESNETNNGMLMTGLYEGSASTLYGQFTF